MRPLKKENLFIAVFSYNRGKYLENCVRSIERNLSEKNIHIYDDGSDNFETIEILKNLSNKYYVEINEEKRTQEKRGGLYFNMNKAFGLATKKGFDYCFFIQDDMQVIRLCDELFLEECEKIFNKDKQIVQIHPKFIEERKKQNFEMHKNPDFYYIAKTEGFGVYDGGILKVQSLSRKGWQFENSEPENVRKAKKLKLKAVFHKNPIFNGLPWPQTYRGGSLIKSILVKIIDKIYGAGFHPYYDMRKEEIKKLLNRPVEEIPSAENWLISKTKNLKSPWIHTRTSAVFFNYFKK